MHELQNAAQKPPSI